jgi:DNA-binding CsgD family transcriptional regulator/GAF domain-containing protein
VTLRTLHIMYMAMSEPSIDPIGGRLSSLPADEAVLLDRLRQLVRDVAAYLDRDPASLVDHLMATAMGDRSGRALLRGLWSVLVEATSHPVAVRSDALTLPVLLIAVRDLEQELLERELARGADLLGRARIALAALRDVRTVDDLFGRAAVAAGELGFDRALLSTVADGTWRLHSMHVDRDARWADEILAVGREASPVLNSGIVEHDVVVKAGAVLVHDVQENRRVNRPLAAVTRSDSYGIAPLTIDGRVVGLLHGDCYHQRRRLGERDRALLALFAEGLSQTLGRVTVLERLDALRQGLADMVGDPTAPMAHQDVGLSVPAAQVAAEHPPPEALTRREHEVMQLLASGDSNRMIARTLSITEGTAKCHVASILRKLDVSSRAEAVSVWLRPRV